MQLCDGHEVLAERAITFGIRTVTLERTEITSDMDPGQFLFRVNGVPVLAKGTNWVPRTPSTAATPSASRRSWPWRTTWAAT